MAESTGDPPATELLRGASHPERVAVITRLKELVELDSPSGERALLATARDALAARLEGLGAEVELIAGPAGDHLRARMAGSSGDQRGILLLAHYDTVWPAAESRRRPFSCEGGIARGPGVLDMKGGLVVLELALGLVRAARCAVPQPVEIVIVADEEVSSPDGRRLVEDGVGRA